MAFREGWGRIEILFKWVGKFTTVIAVLALIVNYWWRFYRSVSVGIRLNSFRVEEGIREDSYVELIINALTGAINVDFALGTLTVVAIIWANYWAVKLIGWIIEGFLSSGEGKGDKE